MDTRSIPAPTSADSPFVAREVGIAARAAGLLAAKQRLFAYDEESTWARRRDVPGTIDLVEGNPHELPPEGFAAALARNVEPRDASWYAYKVSTMAAREAVAATLRNLRGMPFEPRDIHLTTGAFAGLAVALGTVVEAGDEVITLHPSWFFYDTLIAAQGGVEVPVAMSAPFDLPVEAIAAAITPRTRALILNTPHNPTGRIFPPEQLEALARVLGSVAERDGRPIWILADEAYCRIVFDGRAFHSPAAHWPYTFIIYTYGKTLLTPGQRMGYLAVPPTLPQAQRLALRPVIQLVQRAVGYAYPSALMQHALPDLEPLSIDLAALQAKRDTVVAGLIELGYTVRVPEGTFYVLVQSPWADDLAWAEALAQHDVFVLPGSLMGVPGWFRITLTGSREMLTAALPAFAACAPGVLPDPAADSAPA